MAKLLASEYCAEVTQDSFRIHGGYGYSKEYEIERLMREAPFLLIGEGTSEIQKTIICARAAARVPAALTAARRERQRRSLSATERTPLSLGSAGRRSRFGTSVISRRVGTPSDGGALAE